MKAGATTSAQLLSGRMPTPGKDPEEENRNQIYPHTEVQNFPRLETKPKALGKGVNTGEIKENNNKTTKEKESEEGIKDMLEKALKMQLHKMKGQTPENLAKNTYQSKAVGMTVGRKLYQLETMLKGVKKETKENKNRDVKEKESEDSNEGIKEKPEPGKATKPRMLKTKQNLGQLDDISLAAKLSDHKTGQVGSKPDNKNVKLRFPMQENVPPKNLKPRHLMMTNKMMIVSTMRNQVMKYLILRELMRSKQMVRFPKMLKSLVSGRSERGHQCFYNPAPCF